MTIATYNNFEVYQGHYVNEKSQSQKVIYCMILLVYKILKITKL